AAAAGVVLGGGLDFVAFAGGEEEIVFDGVLPGVQLEVAALRGVQRLVGAALQDAAILHDQDLLGAANGGKTVRDNECGAAAHQVAQTLLDERLRFGVEAGGGFVENQDARIGKNGAGDGDALLLAAGQLHAAFADDGVVLLLERFREFIHAGDAAGGEDLFLAGAGPGVGDVF